jgi:two-component system response regulator FlrC
MSQGAVLVVEDDLSLREALCDTLELAGYPVIPATDGRAAIDLLGREDVRMVVSDVQMQPMDGHSLLRRIKTQHPDLPVVLMTAYGTIQKAVEAMRDGAVDYLVKPFEAGVLVDMVSRLVAETPVNAGQDLVAEDEHTRALVALASRVAATDATVLITGQSGSGKEVFARYIHGNSPRADQPFVAINCAAIPENMLEAVLFGYEKGAFTGAYQSNPGKFEQADGGTLLLDEISEMDLSLQAKLLRVLQEREVERLGGRKVIPLDVRVIATSNRSLHQEVAAGRFREDLFYRLSVFPLHLAPLARRRLDILPLAQRMIDRRCRDLGSVPRLSDAAAQRLLHHTWPGNVRELDNVIQRALILKTGDAILPEDVVFEHVAPQPVDDARPAAPAQAEARPELNEDLKSREQALILEALRAAKGSRKAAAERLGISPRTLRYKLARLRDAGIEVPA